MLRNCSTSCSLFNNRLLSVAGRRWIGGLLCITLLLTATEVMAQEEVTDSTLRKALGAGYSLRGTIAPRPASAIKSSNWSVGAETMDRDFTIYANWREYLGPLGAKKARIQSGWAKTEKEQGVFEWAWLDEIVEDMVSQSVEPWVCLCYGNPIYPGGGDTGLGGGLVSSEEALQAWERYVAAVVSRYQQQVDEWEVWNEPRTGRGEGSVQYAKFVIRTAEVIRKIQPTATVLFAAGGAFDDTFAKEVLQYLQAQEKLSLVNQIIYHPYSYNPDSSYEKAMKLRKTAHSFAPHISIRQGENGAPSKPGSFGAIAKYEWTEQRQAKWLLRRLLGDLGHDIPSSYFAICDMQYPTRTNYKGLLAIDANKTVQHRKKGYFAMQHLTAIFDDSLQRLKAPQISLSDVDEPARYAVYGYAAKSGGTVMTLWRGTDPPGKNTQWDRLTLQIADRQMRDPVWVDLLTGGVYDIPDQDYQSNQEGTTLTGIAVYDSPILVADAAVLLPVVAKN